ncbi:uncharacterized protein LOC143577268 [Bidens hawaiensis]|uniref:uncharacterized protein LOC143577268 n=1 Tax=Bidens hawaiensis TaxID=980011 RepID=UPI00404B3A4B
MRGVWRLEKQKKEGKRLLNRKDNDIVLIPYNPGSNYQNHPNRNPSFTSSIICLTKFGFCFFRNHWVLGVLHMKTMTCYYPDSLRLRTVNLQLQQIIDGAMNLYGTQSESKVKLNWVNARCPCQPGSAECGYFMLKFMKEIVDEGIEILVNDNVEGGNNEYTDADIDGIR